MTSASSAIAPSSAARSGRRSRASLQGVSAARARPFRRHRQRIFLALSLADGRGLARRAARRALQDRDRQFRARCDQNQVRIGRAPGRGPRCEIRLSAGPAIPLDADLNAAFAAEIARNREIAKRPGTVAAAVGVDPQNWAFTRILLSENAPSGAEAEQAYRILYLARPLFDNLPL